MSLLEDDRFLIDLNDTQKGLYLMLLALAGKTDNHIRNDISFIKSRLNLQKLELSDLQRISEIYPKLKLDNGYWSFQNFEEHHNYIIPTKKELQRNSFGTPKVCPEEEREEEVEREAFESLWNKYPRREGKKQALKHFQTSVKTQEDLRSIETALGNYLRDIEGRQTDPKYIKMGSTWFNNWQDWINPPAELKKKAPEWKELSA